MNKQKQYVFILAFIQFAHVLDFVILMPLGPTLMSAFQISSAQFATLVSSYNFAAGTSGLIFAIVADQFNRKKLLKFVLFGFTLGTFFCATSSQFSTLLLARIITGVFGGIINSQIFAVVSDLIAIENRGKAIGKIMSSFSIASVLGIPIGLALSDRFGWATGFIFIGIISLVATVMSQIILPDMRDHIKKISIKNSFGRYGKIIIKAQYTAPLILIILLSMSVFMIVPFLSPYGVSNIGIEVTDLKYMYFFAGLTTMMTAMYFGKLTDIYGPYPMFKSIALVSMVPIYMYTNAQEMSLFWYIVLSCFFMSIVSGRMIPGMTLITEVPETDERGTFMGLLNSLRSFGSASSTLIGGLIIQEKASGKLQHFSIIGLISIILTCAALFLAKKTYLTIRSKALS